MVHVSLSLRASLGRVPEITDVLRVLARRARLQRGCVASEAYAVVGEPEHLVLREDWTSEHDLAGYVRSDEFSQVLTLMELAVEPPALEFRFADRTRGLDYVAEIRATETPT